MPKLGEEQSGQDIGKPDRVKYIWVVCPKCKKERWVRKQGSIFKKSTTRLCVDCNITQGQNFRINPKKALEEGRIRYH